MWSRFMVHDEQKEETEKLLNKNCFMYRFDPYGRFFVNFNDSKEILSLLKANNIEYKIV